MPTFTKEYIDSIPDVYKDIFRQLLRRDPTTDFDTIVFNAFELVQSMPGVTGLSTYHLSTLQVALKELKDKGVLMATLQGGHGYFEFTMTGASLADDFREHEFRFFPSNLPPFPPFPEE